MDNSEEQRIISFCTGAAGVELGLRRISEAFRTVCYVEIEAYAVANLVAKIEQGDLDAAPVWTDIKTFDARPFRGKVHGILSGYPCQPFSNAGKRQGTEDPRHLWPYIEQHIRTIRPVWCFFENVSGHLTLGFEEVFKCLRDMGYAVEAGLFTAAEVGAPHKRERLFILAWCLRDGGWESGRSGRVGDGGKVSRIIVSRKSTAEKLAYDPGIGRRTRRSEPEGQQGQASIARSGELADPGSIHAARANPNQIDGQGICERTRGSEVRCEDCGCGEGDRGKQLADTEKPQQRDLCRGSKNFRCERKTQQAGDGGYACTGGVTDRWPARPGQEQYSWEQPRTVKSGMGRAVDGFASRVDELRLLGNGVVPACAELAFRTLWERAHEYKKENLKM